jgi:hypothetical protein
VTVVDDFSDPNFDASAGMLEDESPYPEVRSAVSNTDDPEMPSATFRAWIVGIVWAIIIPVRSSVKCDNYPLINFLV